LNEGGQQLASALAGVICEIVDGLLTGERLVETDEILLHQHAREEPGGSDA
jgi:hypothetical protein